MQVSRRPTEEVSHPPQETTVAVRPAACEGGTFTHADTVRGDLPDGSKSARVNMLVPAEEIWRADPGALNRPAPKEAAEGLLTPKGEVPSDASPE